LTFGLDETREDASRERVIAICYRLMPNYTITDYLDPEAERRPWLDVLSGSQCKLLNIARALIHNVEVLCFHKPFSKLADDDSERLVHALHDHIDSKGLEMSSDPYDRRPRTVLISAATARAVREADSIVEVSGVSGLKLLSSGTNQFRISQTQCFKSLEDS